MSLISRIDPSSWTVRILPLPKRQQLAKGLGQWSGDIVGAGFARGQTRPFVWRGDAPEAIGVPGKGEAAVLFAAADQAVGNVRASKSAKPQAALWTSATGCSACVDLHPAGYANSFAMGCDGLQQVGFGDPAGQKTGAISRALLWSGTAESLVELSGPDAQEQTMAEAVAGGEQVGSYGRNQYSRACLWRGSTASMVVLHPALPDAFPAGMQSSSALGAGDHEQVGVLWRKAPEQPTHSRAALWRGTSASFVDLTPDECAEARAFDCAAGFQVGWASRERGTLFTRAMLWAGSAAERLDLQERVPGPWNSSSARSISVRDGRLVIVGTVGQARVEGTSEAQAAGQVAVWEARLNS